MECEFSEDIVVKEEYIVDDSHVDIHEPKTKCGEVFLGHKGGGFTLVCIQCGQNCSDLPSFGDHIRDVHSLPKIDTHDHIPPLKSEPLDLSEADSEQYEVEDLDQTKDMEDSVRSNDDGGEFDQESSKSDTKTPKPRKKTREKFCCYSCGRILLGFDTYRNHYNRKHPDMIERDDRSKNLCDKTTFVPKVPTDMVCNYCLQTFNETTAYHTHMENAHPLKKYICPHCSKTFRNRGARNYHVDAHEGNRKYKCLHCSLAFTHPSNLEQHLNIHLNIRPFACRFCDKKCLRKFDLKMHERTHLDYKPFHCSKCDKTFKSTFRLNIHLRVHNDLSDLPSDVPVGNSNPMDELAETQNIRDDGHCEEDDQPHEGSSKQHTETRKSFCCYSCGQIFVAFNSYRKHYWVKHPDMIEKNDQSESDQSSFIPKVPTDMLCKYCLKTYDDTTTYHTHMQNAHPDKLYMCTHCPKTFQNKGPRNHHIDAHEGRRRYKCPHCVRAFSHPANRENHVKIHLKIKPFACQYCNYKFVRKYSLKMHERTHKGKRLRCSECDMTFKSEYKLNAHMQKHENIGNVKCDENHTQDDIAIDTRPTEPKPEDELPELHAIKEEEISDKEAETTERGEPASFIEEINFEDSGQSDDESVTSPTKMSDPNKKKRKTFCCFSCGQIYTGFDSYRRHYWYKHPDMIEQDDKSNNDHTSFIPKVPADMLCKYCLKTFNETTAYHGHMENAHPEKMYICTYCPKIFRDKTGRNYHVDTHERKKPYKCSHCPLAFTHPANLEKHVNIHLNIRPFACRFCDLKCLRKFDLKVHESTHTDDKPFQCNECDQAFKTKFRLKIHMQDHTERKNVESNLQSASNAPTNCTLSIKSEHLDELPELQNIKVEEDIAEREETTFIEDVNFEDNGRSGSGSSKRRTNTATPGKQGSQTFCCYSCGKIFLRFEPYRNHYRVKHTDMIEMDDGSKHVSDRTLFFPKIPKDMLCDYCLKTFNDTTAYHTHVENAHHEKMYTCTYCPKAFRKKVSRNYHIDSHEGKKPHKCPHCQLAFTHPANLEKHINIHLNIRPFVCRFCSHKFVRKFDLKIHERTHKRTTPFQCGECDVTFTSKLQLDMHIQNHKNISKDKCLEKPTSYTFGDELHNVKEEQVTNMEDSIRLENDT